MLGRSLWCQLLDMLYLAARFSFLHENKVFLITQLCQSEITLRDGADEDTCSLIHVWLQEFC